MSENPTRRDVLAGSARHCLAGLVAPPAFLVQKAHGQVVWQVDAARCMNGRLGEVGVKCAAVRD